MLADLNQTWNNWREFQQNCVHLCPSRHVTENQGRNVRLDVERRICATPPAGLDPVDLPFEVTHILPSDMRASQRRATETAIAWRVPPCSLVQFGFRLKYKAYTSALVMFYRTVRSHISGTSFPAAQDYRVATHPQLVIFYRTVWSH
jgi:hypothetical protein